MTTKTKRTYKKRSSKKSYDKEAYKKEQQARVDTAIDSVIELFKNGELPEKMQMITFNKKIGDRPMDTWSWKNMLIAMMTGTEDARSFAAWKAVGRFPKKGSKAFYILKPAMITITEKEEKDTNGTVIKKEEKRQVLVGFKPHAVFKYEDTEGKELKENEPRELPKLPLMEKAKEWGIDVKGVGFNGRWYGCFNNQENAEIKLASPDEKVFLHEMAHAADKKVQGKLKGGQDREQEIVAELTAAILCRVVGIQETNSIANSYDYIKGYAMEGDVVKACLSVLSRVEKCINLLLDLS